LHCATQHSTTQQHGAWRCAAADLVGLQHGLELGERGAARREHAGGEEEQHALGALELGLVFGEDLGFARPAASDTRALVRYVPLV
jgi:hypothetical protein